MTPVQRRLSAGWQPAIAHRRATVDARCRPARRSRSGCGSDTPPPCPHSPRRACPGGHTRLHSSSPLAGVDGQSAPRHAGDHAGRGTVRGRAVPRDSTRRCWSGTRRARLSPPRPGDHLPSGRPRSTSFASRCSRRSESGPSARSPGIPALRPGTARWRRSRRRPSWCCGGGFRRVSCSVRASAAPGSMSPITCAPPSWPPRRRCASG